MAEKKASSQKSGAKGTVRIRWVRSYIASPMKHKKIVKGMGFTHLNQVVEREDTPSIRGMVKKIPHLLEFVQ